MGVITEHLLSEYMSECMILSRKWQKLFGQGQTLYASFLRFRMFQRRKTDKYIEISQKYRMVVTLKLVKSTG